MSTEYNVLSSAPVNKQQMENTEFTVSCKPSCDMLHPIECAPQQTTLPLMYTRTGAVPAGQDARLYDLGLFVLATVGSQASPVVGELWCSYDIELLKPQLELPIGAEALSAHYQLSVIGNAGYLGTSVAPVQKFDNIGLKFVPTGTNFNRIDFPPGTQGTFKADVTLTCAPSSGTWVGPNWGFGTGIVQLPIFNNDVSAVWSTPTGAVNNSTQGSSSAVFQVTYGDNVSSITFSSQTLPAQCSGDLVITQINNGLLS